jgi:hypothetical protein
MTDLLIHIFLWTAGITALMSIIESTTALARWFMDES